MNNTTPPTEIKTKPKVSYLVGITVVSLAGIAALAAIIFFSNRNVKTSGSNYSSNSTNSGNSNTSSNLNTRKGPMQVSD